jgi:hypothetical protein
MNCKVVQDDLATYLDGELDMPASVAVKEHLEACGQCRALYVRRLEAWELMDTWKDVSPPGRIRKNIIAGIKGPGRSAWVLRALPVAAALLLVIGLSIYFGGGKALHKKGDFAGPIIRSNTDSLVPESQDNASINEDELISHLHIFQEDDFLETLDELVKIDYLPLIDEVADSDRSRQRSSLDLVVT